MALAPEWMSYSKEVSSSAQGPRFLGRERERGAPKYGRQLSHNSLSYQSHTYSPASPPQPSHDTYEPKVPGTPFACSVSSPPAPPHAPSSILGDPPSRVLNRSKSSPGFASPKSNKPKKSPDRQNFPSFNKPKPKPPKPTFSPSYYKSQSQPNLFNNEKTANWHQQKLQQSPSASNVPSTPSPLSTTHIASPPLQPPSTSPPLPSSSPPPVLVPEIDKLKQLIPATGSHPKSVRSRGVVGPPLPLTKKPPPSISSVPAAPTPPQPPPSTASVAVPPPAALASYFRKATSEPSLMHHKQQPGAQQPTQDAPAPPPPARRDTLSKKARAMEFEKAQIQLLKEAVSAKQPKRSNFFQHLIKKEEQGEPFEEDDSPIGLDQTTTSTTQEPYSPPLSPPMSPPPSSPTPAGVRSPLPEDMEDEERFLRTLGWVPDEEDPVPVLAEEEIADVRVKIILSKQRAQHDEVPVSIDVVGVK